MLQPLDHDLTRRKHCVKNDLTRPTNRLTVQILTLDLCAEQSQPRGQNASLPGSVDRSHRCTIRLPSIRCFTAGRMPQKQIPWPILGLPRGCPEQLQSRFFFCFTIDVAFHGRGRDPRARDAVPME